MSEVDWLEHYRLRRPSATDFFETGVWPQKRERALTRRYIQANPRSLVCSLVVDVDHEDALLRAFQREVAPTPSYVAQSSTGRAHVGYLLSVPVCRTDSARLKPLRFAAQVEAGLVQSLDGDRGYAGFLTKNPTHGDWETVWGRDTTWTLGELADALGDAFPRCLPKKRVETSGLGRNVSLFDSVRKWAYRAVRRFWGSSLSEWESAVKEQAVLENQQFITPLSDSEVMGLVRSVARWVWRNFTPEKFHARQQYLAQRATVKAASRRAAESHALTSMIEVSNGG